MNKELLEQLIGELVGLRAVVQATVGAVTLLAGRDSNIIEVISNTAHEKLRKESLIVPDLHEDAIKARAESTVDNIFSSLRVEFKKD